MNAKNPRRHPRLHPGQAAFVSFYVKACLDLVHPAAVWGVRGAETNRVQRLLESCVVLLRIPIVLAFGWP